MRVSKIHSISNLRRKIHRDSILSVSDVGHGLWILSGMDKIQKGEFSLVWYFDNKRCIILALEWNRKMKLFGKKYEQSPIKLT